ncbi:MAG: HAMP domain-containing histidine kinase [Planctomycetes bacterium]|nr:HAMP domain-containing histidine kinase [Planctomycetota bacterium]
MDTASIQGRTSQGVPPELRPRQSAIPAPARYAWLLAGGYVVFGTAWILTSTWLAASNAVSIAQMEHFEIWKGVAFITLTAALIFVFAYVLFVRIRRQEEVIARQMHAIHNTERAMLAGTFAGTIAHDINNALTVSSLAMGELKSSVRPGSEEARLTHAVDESLRAIDEWNRRLFDLGGRRAGGTVGQVDLAKLVASCVELAGHHAHLRDRAITLKPSPSRVMVIASEQLVRRAVLNLVLNAAEACGPGGVIEVAVEVQDGGSVRIRVDDSGPGVPAALRKRILEPFFTTKPEGTGMGLASVVACADFHHGAVSIGDAPLGGARFELVLKA